MTTPDRIWELLDTLVERHNEDAEYLAELVTLVRRVLPDERPTSTEYAAALLGQLCLLCLLGVEHVC
jgi:hypothetical protein